jgi:dipeptidyl aminopeptidase/acylaminoacyl peptidase
VTTDRRFEQDVADRLQALYLGPMPAYRDEVLARATQRRQRPAWTFVGRWLPVVDVVRRPRTWRPIGIVVLLAILVLALLAALVAGSQRRVPPPFGLARAGLVAYAADGDIYTGDAATAVSSAVVSGPETDSNPHWSRDGTQIAFLRTIQAGSGAPDLYVVRADGSDVRVVAAGVPAITGIYGFSPDGSQILFTLTEDRGAMLAVANSDGSGWRALGVGALQVRALDSGPSWRPPDGTEILFSGGNVSLHAVNVETGVVRTIVGPTPGRNRETPKWSPDGEQLAYIDWLEAADGMSAQTHVVKADGTADRPLPLPPGAVWQAFRAWSNDGTRLLVIRGYDGGYGDSVAAIVPVDGSGTGIEIDYSAIIPPACCPEWEWAPDDRSILGIAPNAQGAAAQILLDPLAGTATAVGWSTSSLPTWQRLAP